VDRYGGEADVGAAELIQRYFVRVMDSALVPSFMLNLRPLLPRILPIV
jgi:hypothetical protein